MSLSDTSTRVTTFGLAPEVRDNNVAFLFVDPRVTLRVPEDDKEERKGVPEDDIKREMTFLRTIKKEVFSRMTKRKPFQR